MHLLRRTNDLHLYSHAGLDEIITTQFRHSNSAPNFKIIFHSLSKGIREIIYEDDALTVETIPLIHKLPCSGFLFREKIKPRRINKEKLPHGLLIRQIANLKKGFDVVDDEGLILYKNEELTYPPRKSRSYAYCSDTCYNERIIGQLTDVDLLYHEATFTMDEELKAIETQHTTAAQAARFAQKANVNKLLIGHFSARYKDLNPILDEAKNIFENSALALEGEIFSIPD
jgi:ribonuclease Z